MKRIIYFITFIIFILSLTGCTEVPKYSLKPMVLKHGTEHNTTKINRTIYIGTYNDNIAKANSSYGMLNPYRNFYSYAEPIKFAENLNELLQAELYRRLSNIYSNVQYVNEKPNKLLADEIFIDGNITNLKINQFYVNSHIKTFDFTNEYKFALISNINNNIVRDSFNANLKMTSEVIKDQINTSGLILAILADFRQIDGRHNYGQLVDHKLTINNQLIADIQYYHFLEDGVGHFKVDYDESLTANILGKYPKQIKDKESGSIFKHNAWNKPYLYITVNFDPFGSPTYNNIWFDEYKNYGKSLYYNDDDIARINKQLEEYNKCIDYNHLNFLNKKECPSAPNTSNITDLNMKYYDMFKLYTTTSGILQYMINEHIDNIIKAIN